MMVVRDKTSCYDGTYFIVDHPLIIGMLQQNTLFMLELSSVQVVYGNDNGFGECNNNTKMTGHTCTTSSQHESEQLGFFKP